ncbi:MAG: hypothetical protein ABI047_15605 [Jatrophihabitantaceae bacterium]
MGTEVAEAGRRCSMLIASMPPFLIPIDDAVILAKHTEGYRTKHNTIRPTPAA